MTRKLSKFFVFAISILIAELVQNYIMDSLQLRNPKSPYWSTLVKMAITVAIYYPLMSYAERFIESVAEKFIQHSKETSKNRLVGMIGGFLVAMIVLFAFYIGQDYHINMLIQLKKWIYGLV